MFQVFWDTFRLCLKNPSLGAPVNIVLNGMWIYGPRLINRIWFWIRFWMWIYGPRFEKSNVVPILVLNVNLRSQIQISNLVLDLLLNVNLQPQIQKSNMVLNLILNVNLRPQIQKPNVVLNVNLNLWLTSRSRRKLRPSLQRIWSESHIMTVRISSISSS